MKRKLIPIAYPAILLTALLITAPTLAQDEGEVIMLEKEFKIRVEPEVPTVVVSIDRQKPDIDIGELKRPERGKIFNISSSIKPRLANIEVSKVKKPKKILAKTRKR